MTEVERTLMKSINQSIDQSIHLSIQTLQGCTWRRSSWCCRWTRSGWRSWCAPPPAPRRRWRAPASNWPCAGANSSATSPTSCPSRYAWLTRFYWVLLGFTGFYWVLLGLIEVNGCFSLALMDFFLYLLRFVTFCLVGCWSTSFYWIHYCFSWVW